MTAAGRNARPNKQRKVWGGPHEKLMKAFEELRCEIDLTVFYDLRKRGTFRVVVSRETDEMADRPRLVAWFRAVSNPVTFFISQ